jgi:hypothetical protein
MSNSCGRALAAMRTFRECFLELAVFEEDDAVFEVTTGLLAFGAALRVDGRGEGDQEQRGRQRRATASHKGCPS